MRHPFKDLVFDFIEDAIPVWSEGAWDVERYTDYIRVTRRTTGQVIILTGFLLLEEDAVVSRENDPHLLHAVRNELGKGVPEHE